MAGTDAFGFLPSAMASGLRQRLYNIESMEMNFEK